MQHHVTLPNGIEVPALGQGTWYLGDDPSKRQQEIQALRTGLDLGMSVVDTAEMYGDGASEELVGEAIAGRRDEVFLVSKVLPSHAARAGTVQACRNSLRRLGTDRLDLYLLHWPGRHPLEETIAGFEELVESGDIRAWGLSNFDADDLQGLPAGAAPGDEHGPQANQILYNLTRRGPEFDLLPLSGSTGMPLMAYSPIEQGRLLGHAILADIADRHHVTPAQVALAWVLQRENLIAIPKASSAEHVRDNAAARDLQLTDDDIADLDAEFPAPSSKQPLDVL